MTSGHLFVIRGDLRTVAADATLVPTDSSRAVMPVWLPLLPAEHLGPSYLDRKTYTGPLGNGWSRGAGRVGESSTWLFPSAFGRVEDLVHSVTRALHVVAEGLSEHQGRVRPLVALLLAGTGAGGLAGHRGAVVRHLLPALRDTSAALGVDVALVLWDDQDSAAVQAVREDPAYWTELPSDLVRVADGLGRRAAAHDLALFLGAGVSRPLGLPDWGGLVRDLCLRAGVPAAQPGEDLADAAGRAVDVLGEQGLRDHLKDAFVVPRCTLAHALLAGLGLRQAVTTNYDTAYEVAAVRSHPHGDSLKVLTEFSAAPSAPWLLKLHGDAASGRDIVLTRSQYDQLEATGQPLRGIVQTLLLTTHVLFVGYSMTDQTYVTLAEQVSAVLESMSEPRGSLGTVLPIVEDPALRRANPTLDCPSWPVDADQPGEGARLLEVLLDRLSWRAAVVGQGAHRHLLDDRYADLVPRGGPEEEVRELALELLRRASPSARSTRSWQVLERALRELGARV